MCDPLVDPLGCVTDGLGEVVSKAANDSLQELVNQVVEAVGKANAGLGTLWVYAPTPVLTAGDGTTSVSGDAPGADAFSEILGYVSGVGLLLCILSVIGFAISFMWRSSRADGRAAVGRIGFALIAVILITGATALVGAILPTAAPEGSSSTVGFLQNSLWYYVGALAVLSVIVAGIRMAWEQRAQPGKDLLQSLITLIVVSGAGLLVISLAVSTSDAFSIWVLNGATDCDVSAAGSTCFGENISALIILSTSTPIGIIGVLILGVIAVLLSFVQIALMVIRGGVLVILAAILPVTASFTNTQMGKQWFQKTVGWTIAFILYKPAAALVYAAAFSLTGSDVFQSDGGGLYSVVTGLALMGMALVALPALLKLIAPATAAVAGGGAAGLALGGAAGSVGAEVATGAVQRSRSSAGAASSGTSAPAATGAATGGGGAAAGAGAAAGGGGAAAGAGAAAAGPVGIAVAAAGAVASGAKAVTETLKGAADDPIASGPSGA